MPSIIVVSGPNEGDYYPLGSRTLVVGRDEGCPIQIVDELVSRKHMQIRHEEADGHYRVLDMQSANGVYLNGRQITIDTPLGDGDIIEIGSSKLMYTSSDFEDRASALEHFKKRGERGKSTLVNRDRGDG
jgi:pSer/pThr/pTyr-binding forkhead associated (FHA) protein